MADKNQQSIRHLLLKGLAVIWALGGLGSLWIGVGEEVDAVVLLGAFGLPVGIGLFGLRKWAWYLAIVQTVMNNLISLVGVAFLLLPRIRAIWFQMDLEFRRTMLACSLITWLFQIFMFVYLTRRPIRALFDIGRRRRSEMEGRAPARL